LGVEEEPEFVRTHLKCDKLLLTSRRCEEQQSVRL